MKKPNVGRGSKQDLNPKYHNRYYNINHTLSDIDSKSYQPTKDMKTLATYQGSVQSIINAKNYSYLYYKDKNEERSLPFIKSVSYTHLTLPTKA